MLAIKTRDALNPRNVNRDIARDYRTAWRIQITVLLGCVRGVRLSTWLEMFFFHERVFLKTRSVFICRLLSYKWRALGKN